MKKLFSRLFIISLASVALSGCDLFSVSEAEKEAEGLELRNYKTAVVRNSTYEFTGEAYLRYADNTEKVVTDKCTYPTLNTSGKVGTSAEYKVSYESTKFIYSKTVYIKIVDAIVLDSLEIRDYTTTVKAKETYTFDGKAFAKYNDGTEKEVTDKVVINEINTSSAGSKDLVVSYTENNITKSVTKPITVTKEVVGITLSGYKSAYQIGDTFSFDGKVMANYSDDSVSDVTKQADINSSNINTSTEGTYKLSASYTVDGKTFNAEVNILVTERVPKVTKITASGFTNTVLKNSKYTFDGVVTAYYDDESEVDVTFSEYCSIPDLETKITGVTSLTIAFKDSYYNTTVKTVVEITVYSLVTSISVPATLIVGLEKEKTISYTVTPSDARNKDVTFVSSNPSVATVTAKGGVVTGVSAGTATITVTSDDVPSVSASTTVTVSEVTGNAWTVLLYICGADLESQNSLATSDIQEILSVSGQPDDVNIVIETGGAKSWSSKYGINSSKLERWHVANKSLVKDQSLTYASMGVSSTLQSFVEYGLKSYPAEKTALILWNHGGGMYGVCYDEKKSNDSLLDNEVKSAVSGALNNCGMSGQKLEWIGYDACLMQVQDIAEMNSPYFNYMVGSEESEAGEGWDYDNWIDDLYAYKSTTTVLQAICDSFISDNGGVNSSKGDQTLSYLDLSKAAAYKTAWENMATQLKSKLTSSNKSTFNSAIKNNVKHYADSDYDYFCLFDAKDFINKLASASGFSSFRIDSSYTTAVLNAHADLVLYSTCQKGAGNSYGLCMYWCNDSTYSDMSVYTTSHTNFTTWRTINNEYGTHN